MPIGLSKNSKSKVLYEKHPSNPNIILKYEVRQSEIHKDKLEAEMAESETKLAYLQERLTQMSELPPEGKDKESEEHFKQEVDRLTTERKPLRDLKTELEEKGAWR